MRFVRVVVVLLFYFSRGKNLILIGLLWKPHSKTIDASCCRAFANLRQSSLDGLTGRGFRSGTGGFYGSSRPRASSSETNLRKLAMNDHMTRPGSALGLLQGNCRFLYLHCSFLSTIVVVQCLVVFKRTCF